MDRVLVVFNPNARRGDAAGRIEQLKQALQQSGAVYDLVATEGPGHAKALARELASLPLGDRAYATLVVAGGDGTINEVVNGMAEAVPSGPIFPRLALFPVGTGNDLAHSLGCALDARGVARALARGRSRRIDLGRLQAHGPSGAISRYFANNCGIGLEAAVTIESNHIKRLRGSMLYLAAALRALRSYNTPQAEIVWETAAGESVTVTRRITLVTLGNSTRAGGGFYLTPDAQLDDGLFDGAIAKALSRPRILMLLPLALFGKHTGDPAVQMIRCKRLSLRSQEPLPIHVDGEVVITDALELLAEIEPARLELVI